MYPKAEAIGQNPLRFTVTIADAAKKGKAQVTCHSCKIQAGKFGFNGEYQRYRCKQCGKTFSDIPESPTGDLRIAPEKVYQVVQLLCEGVGIRAAERITGLARHTVLAVLELAGTKCKRLFDERIQNLTVKHVEIDEVYGFVGCLQQNTELIGDEERGDQYAFLALESETKLIVNWHVGKRDRPEAWEFVQGLRDRTQGRFQLSSDEFNAYIGGVYNAFGGNVDYATEFKIFAQRGQTGARRGNPVVCKVCRRTRQIGKPDLERTTVNHVERNNLNVRTFTRRFTRRTISYSKKLANHRHAVALFCAHFNFCRIHSATKKTPAHAQGLTDHQWTIEELLAV